MARKALLLFLLLSSFACQFKGEEDAGALIAGHQVVTNKFTVTIPTSKSYVNGDTLTFRLTFPYPVSVTGTPRLSLTVGVASVNADYLSGDGTKDLLFTYTVQPGDTDSDGVAVSTTLDLNGGTLTFTGTNGVENCNTTLTIPSTAGVLVDTQNPSVALVSAPANATYFVNMPMTFTVSMTEAVVVTGTPRLTLTIGSTTRYASYISGSGSSTLSFRYTVVAADLDTNGIVVTSPVDLNGGTIKDVAGNAATLTFAAPNTSAVLVDGDVPYVTSVSVPTTGTYLTGTNLDFVFTFSEAVVVNATPSVALTIGATARTANYLSGTGTNQLTFRYTVQSTDLDTDGIAAATAFTFAGGAWIRDLSSNNTVNSYVVPSLSSVLVGDNGPQITGFTVTNSTYFLGQTLNVTANFDQTVIVTGTPRLPIMLNTGLVYATYLSGTGTTSLTFSFTVTDGVDDPNGVVLTSPLDLNGGTIRNISSLNAVLNFTSPSTPLVRISGIRPTILSVTPPADGIYLTGQNMDFVVNMSETVNTGNNTNLWINLTIGSTPVTALYLSGSGSTALTFRYTVAGGDADTDGISVGTLTVNSPGFITDGGPSANAANVTFTPPTTTGVLVNATSPTISAVTPPTNGTYILNQQLNFSVQFSESVNVTGTPTFPITVGSTPRTASYVSGSGTNTLVFRYTVPLNDVDTDGIAVASPIALSGGTIRSLIGVDATLSFTSPNTASINIDGDIPEVVSTVLPPNSVYDTSDSTWTFRVNFDQNVTVTGSPRWVLNVGGTTRYATYASGTGTTQLVFTHTIVANDIDLDGIALGNSGNLDLNGGTILDASSNAANLSLNNPTVSGIILTYPDMVAWYDLDLVSSVTTAACGASNCAATVNDKTGLGYNVTQTGTAQPEYFSSGFGTNNRGYLKFDGVNDFMNMATLIPTIRTVVLVFETEPATMTAQDLFFSSAGGANARIQVTAAGGLTYGGTAQAGWSRNGSTLTANATTGAPGLAASSRYILAIRFSANQTVAATQRLGNTNFSGKIAEVIFFNNGSALTDAQLLPIINYLNAKHGVY